MLPRSPSPSGNREGHTVTAATMQRGGARLWSIPHGPPSVAPANARNVGLARCGSFHRPPCSARDAGAARRRRNPRSSPSAGGGSSGVFRACDRDVRKVGGRIRPQKSWSERGRCSTASGTWTTRRASPSHCRTRLGDLSAEHDKPSSDEAFSAELHEIEKVPAKPRFWPSVCQAVHARGDGAPVTDVRRCAHAANLGTRHPKLDSGTGGHIMASDREERYRRATVETLQQRSFSS
jgi:hypothetical protein